MLDPHSSHELVILGGGITGLTLGLLSARAQVGVTVVDPGLRLGRIDGLMAGVASVQQELQYHHIWRWYGLPAAQAYAEESGRGQRFVLDEASAGNVPVERLPMATVTGEGLEAFWLRREVKAMRDVGMNPVFDDVSGLPFETRPQLITADQASIDVVAYRDHLARAFVAAGGELAQTRPQTARTVVSTTPVPAFGSAGVSTRTEVCRWHWIAIDPPEPPSRMSFIIDGGGRLLVPLGGRLLIGSRRDDGEAWVRERFPGAAVRERWQAEAAASVDGLAFVGYAGLRPSSKFVACGFDAWELTSGTAAALQLHEFLSGDRNDLPWSAARLPRAAAVGRAVWGATRYAMRVSAVTPFPKRG